MYADRYQIKGYAGYDPKKYWSFQTLMNGFQSMLVTPSTEENNHEQSQDEIVSSGLNTERRAKKEKIRLVARRSIEYRPAMDLQHRPKSVQK